MHNCNIIAFAGRKESGKTELAKICENYGYKRISFAIPLKQLVANLINCNIEDINKLKNIDSEYSFNIEQQEYLSKYTSIPLEYIIGKVNNKKFRTVRELLQYIGTDVIRNYNPDWHVNELSKMIEDGKKYVIDDVRFINELNLIKSLNGDCWFIIRPTIHNISNHISEISLNWHDFDKIIINNKTLEYLKFNWTLFLECGYNFSVDKRNKILSKIKFSKNIIDENDDVFTLLDSLFINYKYEKKYIPLDSNTNIMKSIYIKDNKIFIINESSEPIEIDNPLVIEDLKKYII